MQSDGEIDTYTANEMLGFPAEMRTYETPSAILDDLGIKKVELLSNNPEKFQAFVGKVALVTPLLCEPNEHNAEYLAAKRNREKSLRYAIEMEGQTGGHGEGDKEGDYDEGKKDRSEDNETQGEEGEARESVGGREKREEMREIGETDSLSRLKKEVPLVMPAASEIEKMRLGIVRTRWNATLVDSLFEGCKESLLASGVRPENILESVVPGAWELAFAAKVLHFPASSLSRAQKQKKEKRGGRARHVQCSPLPPPPPSLPHSLP